MKRGKYRLMAILLAVLMMTLPFSSAQLTFDPEQEAKEANVGEAIIVNIAGYEPSVIPSSLIEDGDVPVYAFLTGITTGRLLGANANYEPFYSQALIKQVSTTPLDEATRDAVRGSPKLVQPDAGFSMDNLGYLVITLKQIEKEADVPASDKNLGLLGGSDITLKMNAEITFENVERLFGLVQQDMVLAEYPDEQQWKAEALPESSFFSNRGYIRVRQIGSLTGVNDVSLTIYGGSDMVWPYTGAPRPIDDETLTVGETSDYYRLSEMQGLTTNAFRIKLNEIINPSERRAKLKVIINGQEQVRIVKVGSKLYPGSRLTVQAIESSGTADNIKQSVTIKDYVSGADGVVTRTSKAGNNQVVAEKDVCQDNIITLDDSQDENVWLERIGESTDVAVYCTAAARYEEIVDKYYGVTDSNGVLYTDKANFRLGQIYEFLNQPSKALEYYKKAVVNKNGEFMAEAMHKIDTLEKQKDIYAPYIDFFENNQNVRVQLDEVLWQDAQNKPAATVEVSGETSKKVAVGSKLFLQNLQETIEGVTYDYNWEVTQLDSSVLTVQKKYISNRPRDSRSLTERVNLRQRKVIDSREVYVSDINLKRYALISILPGSGEPLISKSNFTIHIPIEKRAIDFTPSQINRQLNKTQEIIKELDDIIEKTDKVVTTWRKVCLVTFFYLTIKSTFFSGLARTQARRFALNGIDGQGGWNQFCRENSGLGKTYSRYDDCILENSDEIGVTINAAQEAVEQVNEDMEDYKQKQWYQELNSDFSELDKYGKYLGEDLQTSNTLRDYRYWQLMKDSNAYAQLGDYNFKKEVDTNLQSFNLTQENKVDAYKKTLQQLQSNYPGFEGLEEQKKLEVFSDLYTANKLTLNIQSEHALVSELGIGTLSRVRKERNEYYAYTADGEKKLQLATVQDYKDVLQAKWQQETDQAKKHKLEEEINRLNQKYAKTGLNTPLTTNQGQVYKQGGNFYVSESKQYTIGELNRDYAQGVPAVEVYPDGKPYCVPTSQGNFVKVLDFHQDGSPSVIQEWNVGSDGLLCTSDDILVRHESVLSRPEYQSINNDLLSQVSRFGRHQKGDVVNINGKSFLVSTSRSQADTSKNQPSCFDTMDPEDCQLLFGVCDPVMCPPSRFNLGGTWQVNDVVQTGLIGSIVLGLPNFDLPYEPVPICLTGVLAGLQNIKSVLRGYVECLNTAQVQGQSVGICDKVRSIYICELLWKEGIAIFNIKGSLFKWVSQTFFGEKSGGGEYLTFESSLQNVADSVSFFTQSYATTAFAAYQSRSIDEVGTTLCKQAIFGKFPGLGSFLDEIAQPESPPQYTALLTEIPYSERLQQSRYQIFYHIYAGEDKPATISVWLEDSTRRLPTYYATDRCEGIRAEIEQGGISSQNLDCIAQSGYDRVCISINGMTECGFGKVSSDFAIDYLNDLIVEDELGRQISSEEECYPSAATTSPSLLSVPLPGNVDILNTGIVRVCSLQNPGSGTDGNKWKVVGSCGKDSTGKSLGSCWLDTTTISIKDTERLANVNDALNQQGFEQQKAELGITGLLTEEQSQEALKAIRQKPKDTVENKISVIYSYSVLSKSTLVPGVAAEASYQAAELLLSEDVLKKALKDPDRVLVIVKAEFGEELAKIFLEYTTKTNELRQRYSGTELDAQIGTLEGQYQEAVDQAFLKATQRVHSELKATTVDVDDLIERELETKLYEEYYNKDLKESTVKAGIQTAIESNCGQCGAGVTNGCDANECHGLGNCYLQKRFFGLTSLGATCNLCSAATSCSDFNDDATMCNNQQCTASLGTCQYLNGKCVQKNVQVTNPAEAKCSFIIDTAKQYLNTNYGDIGDCPPATAQAGQCTTQCGSFVNNVFGYCGVDIGIPTGHGRTKCDATSYMSDNKFTNEEYLQPGDLFVASSSTGSRFGHTGIYVGKGRLSDLTSNRKCFLTFTPDSQGDDIIIHSTGPVCYTTLDQLKKTNQIYTYCRHDACCLDNDPVCHKTQPDTELLAQFR